jgi:hypothetical protein
MRECRNAGMPGFTCRDKLHKLQPCAGIAGIVRIARIAGIAVDHVRISQGGHFRWGRARYNVCSGVDGQRAWEYPSHTTGASGLRRAQAGASGNPDTLKKGDVKTSLGVTACEDVAMESGEPQEMQCRKGFGLRHHISCATTRDLVTSNTGNCHDIIRVQCHKMLLRVMVVRRDPSIRPSVHPSIRPSIHLRRHGRGEASTGDYAHPSRSGHGQSERFLVAHGCPARGRGRGGGGEGEGEAAGRGGGGGVIPYRGKMV